MLFREVWNAVGPETSLDLPVSRNVRWSHGTQDKGLSEWKKCRGGDGTTLKPRTEPWRVGWGRAEGALQGLPALPASLPPSALLLPCRGSSSSPRKRLPPVGWAHQWMLKLLLPVRCSYTTITLLSLSPNPDSLETSASSLPFGSLPSPLETPWGEESWRQTQAGLVKKVKIKKQQKKKPVKFHFENFTLHLNTVLAKNK